MQRINPILNITRYTYLKSEIDHCHQASFNKFLEKYFLNVDFDSYDDQVPSIFDVLDITCGLAYGSNLAIGFSWEDDFGGNRRQNSWYESILQISNRYFMALNLIDCIM